jgi:hypothetical protein
MPVGVLLLLSCTWLADANGASPVPVWTPFEVALQSSTLYANPLPWMTIQLNGTFTLEKTGQQFETPGFWDGGLVWRLRFSPPQAGTWSFTSACSDSANTGLHGANGSFTAVPYAGTNPLYMHGLLRANPGGRFLEHSDGTPFYWLGDTHWSGFSSAEPWNTTSNSSVDPADPAASGSMFKQLADMRAAQGYSVWKAETFAINGQQSTANGNGNSSTDNDSSDVDGGGSIANEGGPAWLSGKTLVALNPSFWAAIDQRVAYVNARHMVVSLAFAGIGRGLPKDSGLEPAVTALARYAVARYAAYSTVWTTCQEYCTRDADADAWARVARSQWLLDPHKRSTSLHNCASNPIPSWRGEEWYGHVTLQQGHRRTSPVSYWLEQYNAQPPRPVIEDEANYELLW